jgi:biopolymer transport protein ExbD
MGDLKETSAGPGPKGQPVTTDEEAAYMERKRAESNARRRKHHHTGEVVGVQLTAMNDITTVLLCFLIVSVTSDPLNITAEATMQLAQSSADLQPGADSVPIVISRKSIAVDNRAIASVNCTIDRADCTAQDFERLNKCETDPGEEICGREIKLWIDAQDKERSDPNSLVIEPLRRELDEIVKQQIAEDEALGRKFKGVVTLVADKEVPFRLLMEVIYTAGKVGMKGKGGLSEFRFAISKVGDE